MDYPDILEIIFKLRDDIWLLWGWVITLNVAIIGWLLQRHGLYGIEEKLIATIAYLAFILLIYVGMSEVYLKIDKSTNDIFYLTEIHSLKKTIQDRGISNDGLFRYYASRSPLQCEKDTNKCNLYSKNFMAARIGLTLAILQNLILFWWAGLWVKVRNAKNKLEK